MHDDITHPELVKALAKPGADIVAGMDADAANLLHMAVGIAGEAGEIIDAVKKHVIYGQRLDRINLIEELGDMEFYLEGLRQEIRVTRETVLRGNIVKLSKRYSEGRFTNEQAAARADKAPAMNAEEQEHAAGVPGNAEDQEHGAFDR